MNFDIPIKLFLTFLRFTSIYDILNFTFRNVPRFHVVLTVNFHFVDFVVFSRHGQRNFRKVKLSLENVKRWKFYRCVHWFLSEWFSRKFKIKFRNSLMTSTFLTYFMNIPLRNLILSFTSTVFYTMKICQQNCPCLDFVTWRKVNKKKSFYTVLWKNFHIFIRL